MHSATFLKKGESMNKRKCEVMQKEIKAYVI